MTIAGAFTLGVDLGPDGLDHQVAAEPLHELGVGRLVDQRTDTRQGYSPNRPGIAYPSHLPVEIRLAGS